MADNVTITPGSGNVVAADEVTDGTLGQVKVQYIKLMDGTLDSTNKAVVDATGDVQVDVNNFPASQTVNGTVAVSNFPATQPVSGSVSVSNFPATQPVSGTVTANAGTGTFAISAASLPLPTGASTEATLSSLNGKVTAVNTGAVTISTALPAGTNVIGHVIADSGSTTAVTGNVTAVQPTGTNLHTVVDSGTITLSGTSPVSGTVTANQGTPNSLANGWPVELSDGTNLLGVTAHPVRIDPTGTTTQPVSGTVAVNNFPATQPVSGTVTAVQSTGTNLHVVVDSAPTTAVTGTFFQATQPVSGTVTANQGTPNATPWNQNIAQVNGVALGSPSAYGTSPGAVNVSGVNAFVTNPVQVVSANLGVTATGAAAAAVTATLPAVAGQFHYITGIEIVAYTTVARTGSATVVLVTSTNLPGSNVWDFQSAAAIGTSERQVTATNSPIKSAVVNTATTIVCPATTSVIWRVNVYYFTAA
jgi:hypothetical protein